MLPELKPVDYTAPDPNTGKKITVIYWVDQRLEEIDLVGMGDKDMGYSDEQEETDALQ